MNEFPLEFLGAACLFPGRTENAVFWPGDDGGWKVGRVKCLNGRPLVSELGDIHGKLQKCVEVAESHGGPQKMVVASVIRPYPEQPIPEPGNG